MININFGGISNSWCDSDRYATIVFFRDCPYTCQWCQNKSLNDSNTKNYINLEVVKILIAENSEYCSEVVVSGGEPLLQINALIELLRYIKSVGLLSGIETSGFNSHKLIPAFEDHLIDFIYLDFKTLPQKYEEVTGYHGAFNGVYTLMLLCKKYGIPCELRTTNVPEIITPAIISQIKKIADSFGFKYKVQEMR